MIVRAVDSETLLITPGCKSPTPVCVTYAVDGADPGIYHHADAELLPALRRWLENDTLVFANAPFDLAVFARRWPELMPLIWRAFDEERIVDVLLNEKLNDLASGHFKRRRNSDGVYVRKGYSLKELCYVHTGRKMRKDKYRLDYHDRIDLSLSEWEPGAIDYATDDAGITLLVWQKQPRHPYLSEACAADFALYLMSCFGLSTCAKQTEKMKQATLARRRTLKDRLVELDWVYENKKTASGWSVREKRVKMYAHRVLAGPKPEPVTRSDTPEKGKKDRCLDTEWETWSEQSSIVLTDTALRDMKEGGKTAIYSDPKYVSLSADALADCDDPDLKTYAEYNRLSSLLNGPIKQMEAGSRGVPIRARFESMVSTGRTSSSGPNLHNSSREPGVRECFVSPPGYAIVSCDYDAAELHTFAQWNLDTLGVSEQGDALNRGVDCHSVVGAQLMGIPYDEFVARRGEDVIEEHRQWGKAANFGFPGGMGAKRFAAQIGCSLEFATRIREAWIAAWEEAQLYLDHISNRCRSTFFHRQYIGTLEPRIPLRFENRSFCQAANVHFQALAAVGMKRALVQLTRDAIDPSSVFVGCRPVNAPHDEILCVVPFEKLDKAARHMRAVMEREFTTVTPDFPATTDLKAQIHWSKKAEGIYDVDGKLVPWESRLHGTVYTESGEVFDAA